MAAGLSVDITPILEILNRPIGDSSITVGFVIVAFIIFYIIASHGGRRW